MCKDGFYFFTNYRNIAKDLPVELRSDFYEALMDYAIDGIEPENGIIKALITAIKPSLDKVDNRGGYREGAGRKPNQTESNEIKNNQKESKIIKNNQSQSNDNQKNQSFNKQETRNIKQEILKEKDNLKVIPKEKFVKPTIEELKSYFAEKGYEDESERFYDFYSSKGWMVGKNSMKDWRAAVRNWARGKEPQQILKPKQTIEEKNRESLVEFLKLSGKIQ
jgi:hypothetical protein